MGKPVRMADIAERLHISVVSVSKALSGKSGVSEEMRAKVVALAQEMGYESPRPYGERTGCTGNIGVLVSDRFFDENTFYNSLYRSIVLSGGSEGYTSMLEIVSLQAEADRELPAMIFGRKVDGLIFMGNFAQSYLETVTASGLPFVLLDFHIPGQGVDCVVSDNLEGGSALTEHLLVQGRREIGFVGSILSTSSIMDRYLGYQRALRTAGIVPWEEWRIEDRDQDGVFIPLDLPEPLPEAFLCSCDEVAYILVEELRRRGIAVPADVAVCGYDDYRYATLCQPALTTYRVDTRRMARTAVARLTDRIRGGEDAGVCCTIPGQIVVRGSSVRE